MGRPRSRSAPGPDAGTAARRRAGRAAGPALAVVAGAALGVALLVGGGAGGPALGPGADDGVAAATAAPPRSLARPAAPVAALDPAMLSAAALREALARYQTESRYPPDSHLHDEATAGQRPAWNQPFAIEVALDDRPGSETVVRFVPDRHHVEFGEALTATLEVVARAEPARRLPVTIHSAVVIAAGAGRTGVAFALRDDGGEADRVAGDHLHSGRLVPAQHEELATARRVRVQAHVEAGGVERLVDLDFTYTPRPLLELVGLHATAAGGGLTVTLDLEVHEPGAYAFAADVAAGDQPVGGMTPPWTELAAGRQRVELALFGKVLHDRGLPGPYTIRNLRAERRADAAEVEAWWSDPRELVTEAFPLAAFSAAAWDGPERQEIIATLEQSIVEQEAAERTARR